eukprot:scaffold229022_cov19-Prasinocladus_malaysianus.AAC.1
MRRACIITSATRLRASGHVQRTQATTKVAGHPLALSNRIMIAAVCQSKKQFLWCVAVSELIQACLQRKCIITGR